VDELLAVVMERIGVPAGERQHRLGGPQ